MLFVYHGRTSGQHISETPSSSLRIENNFKLRHYPAFVSLDGAMQSPGGTTEDPTGGFNHGGWLPPVGDEVIGKTIGDLFSRSFDLLLGQRTYDIFAAK